MHLSSDQSTDLLTTTTTTLTAHIILQIGSSLTSAALKREKKERRQQVDVAEFLRFQKGVADQMLPLVTEEKFAEALGGE